MKSKIVVIFAAVVGFLIGWNLRGAPNKTASDSQEKANVTELAKLYPSQLALSSLKDIRVLVLLSSNDVAGARTLLLQDLKSHVSSLSGLSQETALNDFDRKALTDAQSYLAANR